MAHRLLVSTRKGLLIYDRAGGGWTRTRTVFLGENVTLAAHDARDGALYAALNLGHFGVKLKRSGDGGETWEDVAVPAYPEGEMVKTGDGKPPRPATLSMIWALAPGGADQPGRLWAGTLPGGLFRSDDRGATWSLVRGLWDRPEREKWFGGGYDTPGIHSICVDPRDSRTLRLALSCGGAWISHDEGATWEKGVGMFADFMPPELRMDPDIQDAHRMVQCAAAPDALWVQHHNGVFRSTDGGKNWVEVPQVPPSVFGFAVAVHPRDPQTAWFAPAVKDECRLPVDGKLVVTRTRDGGKSFTVHGEGLPQHDAFDLIYRHALAVDETGDRLALGSTTGGLWVSENGGDRWSEISSHLPPV
ncbi:MAG: exo-alpha-sialidase, partial [Planctomycetaceae bacterium]|nr:exo-alpha-sialidase [Planctomycetaceae bacterium]